MTDKLSTEEYVVGTLVDVEPTFGGIYYYVKTEDGEEVEYSIDPMIQLGLLASMGHLLRLGEKYKFSVVGEYITGCEDL